MIGVIGVGDMGLPMSGHMVARGFDVVAYDVDRIDWRPPRRAAPSRRLGCPKWPRCRHFRRLPAHRRSDGGRRRRTGPHGRPGQLIVVAGTHSLDFMQRMAGIAEPEGHCGSSMRPSYSARLGAREGNLLSLCGGEAADVERARPVMLSYSRGVEHVGPLGAGQLAKTCNNLLHWIHCVANFETLAIAKRYGVDAQRMREVLLKCPGDNGTLRRWDSTRFTWQEKDMDFVIELGPERRAGVAVVRAGRSTHQDADRRRRGRIACTDRNAPTSDGRSHRWPKPTVGYNRCATTTIRDLEPSGVVPPARQVVERRTQIRQFPHVVVGQHLGPTAKQRHLGRDPRQLGEIQGAQRRLFHRLPHRHDSVPAQDAGPGAPRWPPRPPDPVPGCEPGPTSGTRAHL